MKVLLLLCLGIAALSRVHSLQERIDYTEHVVVNVVPPTDKSLQLLRILEQHGRIKFWREPTFLNRHVSFQISGSVYEELRPIFTRENMNPQVVIPDIQKAIDGLHSEIKQRKAQLADSAEFDFGNFHTYSEITAFMQDSAANNTHVTYSSIGKTFNGLDIAQATVSPGGNALREVIFLECGIHAKEWIGPSTCIWIFDQLASGYGSNPEITALVEKYDWVIVPIINPDGYDYSWTSDRLWRKNRALIADSPCTGVDINRNYDANFGGIGSSALPCSDKYHGPEPFSENESTAMRNSMSEHAGRIKAFVSIHTYGGIWMTPYGYSPELPPEYEEMYRVMKIGAEALTATYGTPVEYANEGSFDYLTSGTTRDYAYLGQNITYPYTIESRNVAYGYLAPASEIIPTAQEIWNGIKAMANALV